MRNQILALAIFLPALQAWSAGDMELSTYYECDFSNGLPAGVVVEDRDGAELHFLMKQEGFEQGDSWKVLYDRTTTNYYAASPSMHKTPDGQQPVAANDWMTLPSVLIRGGEATLSWRARSVNAQTSTGAGTYSVYVNGTEVLASATAPKDNWEQRSISLSDYAGRPVVVSFVNNTLGGEILGIDDIALRGLSGVASVEASTGEWCLGTNEFFPGIIVTATDPATPITSIALTCTMDGQTYTANAGNLNLSAGEEYILTVEHKVEGRYGDSFTYTLLPEVNGTAYDPITVTTNMLAFRPHKRTVLEETTGQWCGWCPLGIQANIELHELFGNDVIPIAIHVGQDDMAFDEYAQAIKLNSQGQAAAPLGLFDREVFNSDPMKLLQQGKDESYSIWHGGFATDAELRLKLTPMVQIDVTATLANNNSTVEVATTTRAAMQLDNVNMRVALTLVEDDVWKPGYYQTNYLARYKNRGPVGDFTERPEHITDNFSFSHVARAVADNAFQGIEGSLPPTLGTDDEYPYNYSWPVPSSVLNPRALTVVAMLIDKDGIIVNAASAPADPTYVSIPVIDNNRQVDITVDGGTVCLTADGYVEGRLIDLTGRTVAHGSAVGQLRLTATPGIYILEATGAKTLKIRL